MKKWEQLADDFVIDETVKSLKTNNIDAFVVKNSAEAKDKVLSILPKGAEVMDMTSITLKTLDILDDLHNSEKYDAVKPKLAKLNRKTDGLKMQKMGAAPEWAIGSVHAVTRGGHVIIASMSGSQLPAYAYGSTHVIWVVGTNKIVDDVQAGWIG